MLTDAETAILEKWRKLRAQSVEAHVALDADGIAHDMPALVVFCDQEIEKLEAKAALP